ncbi:MAG: hypothetical protein AAFR76_09605 [Planctomycetota bacterium]
MPYAASIDTSQTVAGIAIGQADVEVGLLGGRNVSLASLAGIVNDREFAVNADGNPADFNGWVIDVNTGC